MKGGIGMSIAETLQLILAFVAVATLFYKLGYNDGKKK